MSSTGTQPNFIRAYDRLIETLNHVPADKYIELIKYFFEIGTDYGQPPYNPVIETLPAPELKSLLYNLTKEVVNLDMCFYIARNINPRLGEKFKAKIAELI